VPDGGRGRKAGEDLGSLGVVDLVKDPWDLGSLTRSITYAKFCLMKAPKVYIPQKIVSGGQTGVDRAGLELAILLGIEHGGWCPLGRLAEDGTIPSRYELTENDSRDYKVRTRQNVIDSDATLILYASRLSGGTLLTKRIAQELERPCLCVRLDAGAIAKIAEWLNALKPKVLNIAGPRQSSAPGIDSQALDVLLGLYYD
jgi:hypothetical protein